MRSPHPDITEIHEFIERNILFLPEYKLFAPPSTQWGDYFEHDMGMWDMSLDEYVVWKHAIQPRKEGYPQRFFGMLTLEPSLKQIWDDYLAGKFPDEPKVRLDFSSVLPLRLSDIEIIPTPEKANNEGLTGHSIIGRISNSEDNETNNK